jgi:NAD(P)-dependent dehydrogenase (short-subunit alcohol dehydrogenase family)
MRRLDNQTAVITGASRGLGRAVALSFAREGAHLALCARDREALNEVAAEARALGADVLPIVADLRSTRDVERVVMLTLERFSQVDILVNNASELGPTPLPQLVDFPPHVFADVIKVNLQAPFHLTWALLGGMLQRDSGVVINVTSDVAVHGYPGWGAYSVSKAAIEGLTRTWAAELEGTGVRIFAVDPGDMATEMHARALPDDDPSGLADPVAVAEAFTAIAAGEVPPTVERIEAGAVLAATQTGVRA